MNRDGALGWCRSPNPFDRIVVPYGAGHAFLLRRCVEPMPGFTRVEPNPWRIADAKGSAG